ncbi:MAG: Gfo/Idh/MocA family protein [Actinomycetota bacterium]
MEPLRIAVVGVGSLALRGILPHLTEPDVADRVRVTALCDPVVERAREAAERFGVPAVESDYATLLARDDVDAVTLVTPIGLHAEQCLAAIAAGKHVHVNKTMTTTVAEADAVIAAAAAAGVRIVASPGEQLRPQLSAARDLIRSGAIGRLSWAICGVAFGRYHEADEEAVRRGGAAGVPIDPSWYFRRPGGGPMYDMAVYALHGLTAVLGPARRVTAMSGIVEPVREFLGKPVPVEMDDNTIALLDFGDGAFAVVHGTAAGGLIDDFGAGQFFGTEGTIRGLTLNGEPFDFPGRELTTHAPTWDWDAQMAVLPHVRGAHRSIPESHVFEDIMQLVDWVLDGTPTLATAEHARHVIDIVESAYRAAETGTTQDLRTDFPFPPGPATRRA